MKAESYYYMWVVVYSRTKKYEPNTISKMDTLRNQHKDTETHLNKTFYKRVLKFGEQSCSWNLKLRPNHVSKIDSEK